MRLIPCSSVVERFAVNEDVAGSSPAGGAIRKKRTNVRFFLLAYIEMGSKP